MSELRILARPRYLRLGVPKLVAVRFLGRSIFQTFFGMFDSAEIQRFAAAHISGITVSETRFSFFTLRPIDLNLGSTAPQLNRRNPCKHIWMEFFLGAGPGVDEGKVSGKTGEYFVGWRQRYGNDPSGLGVGDGRLPSRQEGPLLSRY